MTRASNPSRVDATLTMRVTSTPGTLLSAAMISRLLRLLAAFALLASFACGGDDGDVTESGSPSGTGSGSAGAPEESEGGGGETVSPSAYATSICTGVDDWFQAIQSHTEQLNAATADLEGDLDGAKESIQTYIDDVVVATDELLEEVEDAGQPDVDEGDEVAAALHDGFEQVKAEFEKARDEIDAVGTDDAEEFVAEFQRIGGRLQDGSAMEEAFSGLNRFSDNEELDRAFDEEEACQAISG